MAAVLNYDANCDICRDQQDLRREPPDDLIRKCVKCGKTLWLHYWGDHPHVMTEIGTDGSIVSCDGWSELIDESFEE